ncbi:chaperone protein HtpG [Aliidongia dinghuensis]|uniref:Chaperone protein HtpG n=1 Tax=Aliidongia dinghuensis TaxID=1867774 RepID=A0A8J2YYU9_9PROT|nr:molecular chaperone HtpG [Aliidongia dinghuensis]GGF33580.1 chaperone protein HtpG [Aliidongia dinghuensis]
MAETRSFQAEVSRLLDIVAHSLYSDKKVFLRELISNASDACDRRRYLALTEPALGAADGKYRVVLKPDPAAKTLSVIDNGIGMSEIELIENLGTIARSGTSAFLKGLGQDSKRDMTLIGQFGVGFYSAFMVADKVEVVSLKAGESQAHRWESDGKGSFTVSPVDASEVGTRITLYLKEEEKDYMLAPRLKHVVKTYADHIALPILLEEDGKEETLNSASALWTRPKNEVTAEQAKEFYHTVAHAFDDPWLTLHYKAEGVIEYTSMLFVPGAKPFDLFDPARKHSVRLYVRRVFVTDDCAELVPAYLRFLKGVVDSEDLPLNISRETLQASPLIAKIRQGVTKRVLGELAKKAADAQADYAKFWDNFGAVLKEGLYEDFEQREALLSLARFRSTAAEGLVSLEDYVGRMKPGQTAIYTITADSPEAALRSPQLEGFRAKGVEVLLLTDPVDEFWLPMVAKYKEHEFRSVTRGGADLSAIEGPAKDGQKPAEPPAPAGTAELVALLKLTLADAVKDVRSTDRLTESAVCLVADEGDMDMHLARLLKQHKQLGEEAKRVLEVNPRHPLIQRLAERLGQFGTGPALEDAAWLLLDQARIVEGEALPDPVAFAKRLASCLERGLAA